MPEVEQELPFLDLKVGKLYRLKRSMHVRARMESLDKGSVVLLVRYEAPSAKASLNTSLDDFHMLTLVFPDGEVERLQFTFHNIPRFLEPCHNNSNNQK